jgi:hypothetical protein
MPPKVLLWISFLFFFVRLIPFSLFGYTRPPAHKLYPPARPQAWETISFAQLVEWGNISCWVRVPIHSINFVDSRLVTTVLFCFL